MRIFKALLFALAVAPSISNAQMKGMPTVEYMPTLLMSPQVQQDLHLSPALAQQEQGLIMQAGMKMLPMLQQKQNANREQMAEQMKAAFMSMQNEIVRPLNAAQRARLHQLTLQMLGPVALAQPNVVRALKLTAAQQSRINEVVATSGRETLGHMPKGGPGQNIMAQAQEMRKAQNRSRAISEQKVNQILTSAQRRQWDQMQGRKLPGVADFSGLGSMFGGM